MGTIYSTIHIVIVLVCQIKDAKNGNAIAVRSALGMGANVEALDKEKVMYLICYRFKSDLNLFFDTQEGWVALAWASHNGHLDAVDHLLSRNANPNVQCGVR